jgi:hypothetical protein
MCPAQGKSSNSSGKTERISIFFFSLAISEAVLGTSSLIANKRK